MLTVLVLNTVGCQMMTKNVKKQKNKHEIRNPKQQGWGKSNDEKYKGIARFVMLW